MLLALATSITSADVSGEKTEASIFCLLVIAFLVSSYVVAYLCILLQEEPEHPIKFLGRLNLHLRVRAYVSETLLQVDYTLDVMWLER